MWSYAKLGWSTARRCWFLLFLLFLYQYGWGFALYKYVKSIVVPLLHRYPAGELPASAERLFWIEAEFQLMKTDLITSYLWTFGIFLLLRLTLTPLINGGIYYALSEGRGNHRKKFFHGVKAYAKPFLLLYLLQILLTFVPLIWAVPRVLELASAADGWTAIGTALLPYVLGWLAYQGALDLAFMYVGFGIVSGHGGWRALTVFARHALPIVLLALATYAIAGAVSLAATSLSMVWAGYFAVLLHQSFPIVRALVRLWSISSQHHLWSAHKPQG